MHIEDIELDIEKKGKRLDGTSAVKHDAGKPRVELVSEVALLGLAEVLTFGEKKYAADNWRKGMEWRRLIGSAFRHLLDFSMGVDMDRDSGLPSIDHLACCVMFLSEYQKRNLGTDDRWKMLKVEGKDTVDEAAETVHCTGVRPQPMGRQWEELLHLLVGRGVDFRQDVGGWWWSTRRHEMRNGPFAKLEECILDAGAKVNT